MFMLVRIYRNGKGDITGYDFVEDGLATPEEARQVAYDSGPGEYHVLSRAKQPGNRVVDTVVVEEDDVDVEVASELYASY